TRGTVARVMFPQRARSAGVTTAVQLAPLEVIPATVDAHLDDIAGELFARRLELGELRRGLDAPAVGAAQAVAVDVRHQHEALRTADRAGAVERPAQVAGRPEQLGLGIADVESGPLPGAQVAQHRPAGECVIDVMAHGRSVATGRTGRAGVYGRENPCRAGTPVGEKTLH